MLDLKEIASYKRTPPGGGVTSLSDHTGMCTSLCWFLARITLERDVRFKEKFWDWGLIFAQNSGNAQVRDN